MGYIHFAVNMLFVIIIYIAIAKFTMWLANVIGEKSGVGKSIMQLWKRLKK